MLASCLEKNPDNRPNDDAVIDEMADIFRDTLKDDVAFCHIDAEYSEENADAMNNLALCCVDIGKDIYAKNMYTWVITLDVKGKNTVTLPNNPDLIVLSACQVENGYKASLVTQLYDEVEQRDFTYKKTFKEKLWYLESKLLWNINDTDDYFRHNNNGKNGKRVEQSKRHTKSRTVETVGH